jgi:hypothetical protein
VLVKHSYRKKTDKIILDSDSSLFDKNNFPKNYIEHIKKNIGKVDVILISSHKEIRDELLNNNIFFILIYPDLKMKNSYIQRYKDRKNSESFISLINNN